MPRIHKPSSLNRHTFCHVHIASWCRISFRKHDKSPLRDRQEFWWLTSWLWYHYAGPLLLSGKTSYRQISWSLEAARLGVILIVSLWNLTGITAALLPRCLVNFRAIGKVQTRISRLRDFTRSCGKTSYRLVNRGPGVREFAANHTLRCIGLLCLAIRRSMLVVLSFFISMPKHIKL